MDNSEKMHIEQDKIIEEIYQIAQISGLSNETISPIADGIYDISEYLASNPKIMWILKEPYDDFDEDGNPIGGGWFLNDAFDNENAWKNKTWQPIIYIVHGIKNRCRWQDMDWIRDDISMVDRLKEIAYINVSKMPNRTGSDDNYVHDEFIKYWKDIVNKQIILYKPDVIICGNTYWMIHDKLESEILSSESVVIDGVNIANVHTTKDYSIIDTYHPNQKVKNLTRKQYVNTIIEIALKNQKDEKASS